jgi:predicted neuraminidase
MDLPNPNAGTDMIRLISGNLLLAFNNSKTGRTPLSLAISEDGGASWKVVKDVESDPGEYSYPSLCQGSDGVIHLTYTFRRETIKHVGFIEDWLK